ncbi:MAG: NAD(P)-dependent oxidoreductase [Rubrivivax sp.]|nr:NAD(P)-dependent oxidoreductase [Rubrivivax sp.]
MSEGTPPGAKAPGHVDLAGRAGRAHPVDLAGPVGLIGLGLVGTALSARLEAAGFGLLGCDRDAAAKANWLAGAPARRTTVASATELGHRCEVVVLAVFDTAGVIDVIEGSGGLLEGTARRTVVDTSTGDPAALELLAARLAARGVRFIEAPLSGSSAQITEGSATMLLGGDAKDIDASTSLLAALSPRRIHVGGAGMGARAKLATNLVLGLNRAALAEGLVFAERLGIAPATFLELVLATPARSDAALAKGERMVQGDFAPQSRVRQHLKDVELMLQAAHSAGQRLPLTDAHARLLRAAVAAGDGELDNAAIVRQLRREAEARAEQHAEQHAESCPPRDPAQGTPTR